jgi:hypothetical protein
MKCLAISLALLGGLTSSHGEKPALQWDVEISAPISDSIQSQPNVVALLNDSDRATLGKSAFIPHSLEVRTFTPPAPPEVKRLPAVQVHAATTRISKNSRSITLQRGVASTEPDLPPLPPTSPSVELRDSTPEEIAQRRWHHRHNFNLGATIYDHKISVINWTNQESLVRHEAVCGFDIGLLAGISGFIHNDEDYSLFMMHSDFDTTWVRRLSKHEDLKIPDVAPGEIHITQGNVKDGTATALMTVIKEIITAETPRLLTYQAERKTYFAAAAAWDALHPPIPRDEIFILRPHRGSHYQSGAKSIKPARP